MVEPLLSRAARRVGLGRAFKVLGFMGAWRIVEQSLGREPTMIEYCKHWSEPQATAYRHRELFLKAFPGETSPSRLVAEVGQRDPGLAGLLPSP